LQEKIGSSSGAQTDDHAALEKRESRLSRPLLGIHSSTISDQPPVGQSLYWTGCLEFHVRATAI
jgi:hypothetical protein